MGAINVYFEGRTLEEVRKQIRESGILGDEPTLIMPGIDPEVTQPDVNAEPQPEETAAPVTQQDVKPEPAKIKMEEVRAAANTYRDKHGIEALRAIFAKHGGERLKDIPESEYAAVMKEIS